MVPQDSQPSHRGTDFRTTHWSVVLNAGDDRSPDQADALERLCRTYWPAVYAFIRRRGRDEHDAKDLTQAFFERILAKDWIREADASRGKFRTFLLTSVTHFLANEWDKTQRQKRGGGAVFVSLDDESKEE